MIRSILTPLDGSTFSEHALPVALEIARRAGALLRLVHVHAFSSATVYLEGGPFVDETVESLARKNEQLYLERLRGWLLESVGTDVQIGVEYLDRPIESLVNESVGNYLAKYIADSNTDLVVMTTHGRSGMDRLWLGSVAEELVRKSHTPILLLRPAEQNPNYLQLPALQKLLIPLDGSPVAEAILEPALTLAPLIESNVSLLRVVTPFDGYMDSDFDQVKKINEDACAEAEQYLEQLAQKLEAGHGKHIHRGVLLHPDTARTILQDAQQHGNDWLALATHGRSGFKRFLLGSVAENVLRKTTLPVLLYRPKEVAGK